MKVRKKNVYYCEHCKKKGLAAHVIIKHEKGCTANPNRICGICDNEKGVVEIVAEFKKRFTLNPTITFDSDGNTVDDTFIAEWTGEPVTLEEIRNAADHCPACTLKGFHRC